MSNDPAEYRTTGSLGLVARSVLPWIGWILALLMAVMKYVFENPPPV